MNTRLWIAGIGVIAAQLLGMASAPAAVYTASVSGYIDTLIPITLAADTQYTITMTGTGTVSASYTGYYLYDSSKTHSITSGYANGSVSATYALKAGSYWIRVWGNDSYASGSYTITTSEVAAPLTNDSTSNDSKTAAIEAPLGAASSGHIAYTDGSTRDWDDWWKITLPSDGLLTLDFNTSGKSTLFDSYSGYYLYSANDNGQNGTYGLGSTAGPFHLKAGTYYVRLWVNSSSEFASYTMTPRLAAAPLTNDSEPNDSKATAQNATLEAANTGHIGYTGSSTDWDDWWTFTLPSDGLLTIDFTQSQKSDLFLSYSGYYLYSANDNGQSGTYGLGSTAGPFHLKAGTYYIRFWVNSSSEYSSYSFTPKLSAASYGNDSEPNDSKSTAQTASLNALNTGHIGYTGSSTDWDDWWKFTLSSDDTLTLNFETSGASSLFGSYSGYYLYNSNDSQQNYTYGLSASAGPFDLKAGTYYMRLWCNSSSEYAGYAFTPTLKSGQGGGTTTTTTTSTSTTSTTSTSTTSTSTTTATTTTTTLGGTSGTTNLLSLGAWNVYGTASLNNGTLTMGDFVGYDTADSDNDGNPYNTWNAGSASGGSGVDYDEAVTIQEFARPLKLSWIGCFPETSQGYHNIFLGRKNTAFTGTANSKQYPITQEFGFSTRWDMAGLNTTVLSSDVQRVTAATATSDGYCADYAIEWWANDLLKFYYNGTLVREQTYTYVGPVSVLVRSFEKPHTFTTMTMEALTSSAGDTQAPTVPGGLTAIAGSSSQISLSWTASIDAVGVTAYKVYRGEALITTLGDVTTYSDTNLTASTTYSYTIAACDAASNCSPQSYSASATTQQGTSTSADSKSDCLFNWAENQYGALFSPKAQSLTFGPYYLRYYSQTSSYLAVTSNSLVYLGPLSGNQLLDLGSATTWYANAGCN